MLRTELLTVALRAASTILPPRRLWLRQLMIHAWSASVCLALFPFELCFDPRELPEAELL